MGVSNVLLCDDYNTLFLVVPEEQLLDRSLQVVAPGQKFNDWSTRSHAESYFLMQSIVRAWKKASVTTQYLIYGKVEQGDFKWEIVPYQKCSTVIGRIAQQLLVLWRSIFGGVKISEEKRKERCEQDKEILRDAGEPLYPLAYLSLKGGDPFCKEDTIKRQRVLEGEKVNVLFNYAPIGFGGEKLHFLVVPKAHRKTFVKVSEKEYCESLDLTKKIMRHFNKTRDVHSTYLLNKTGEDAGQTVQHWHLHVIISTSSNQDFWGKMTVLKNILLGSSPMKEDTLAARVKELRDELESLGESLD